MPSSARWPTFIAGVLALFVPACLLIGPNENPRRGDVSDSAWELRRILLSGVIVDAQSLEPPATLTFSASERGEPDDRLETGAVEGYTGCNDLTGRYAFEEDEVGAGTARFTDLIYTERACAGVQGQVDQLFIMGLQHADRYTIEDGILRIVVAPNAPAPATTLEFTDAG